MIDQNTQNKFADHLQAVETLKVWFEKHIIKEKISYTDFSFIMDVALHCMAIHDDLLWNRHLHRRREP